MKTLRVSEVLKDRVLVSREAARSLQGSLAALLSDTSLPQTSPDAPALALDFEGVEGIAPSFLDELLTMIETFVSEASTREHQRLAVLNLPTRLSLKFEAVARGHGMSVQALPDGSWRLAKSDAEGTQGKKAG